MEFVRRISGDHRFIKYMDLASGEPLWPTLILIKNGKLVKFHFGSPGDKLEAILTECAQGNYGWKYHMSPPPEPTYEMFVESWNYDQLLTKEEIKKRGWWGRYKAYRSQFKSGNKSPY